MKAMMSAAVRSGVFWQVVIGFALGTLGTLAAHNARAERQAPHSRPAQHWRIDR